MNDTRGGTLAFTLLPEDVARERNAHVQYGYHPAANGQGFHWRGGLYFRRDHSGNVVISDWRPFVTDDGRRMWTGLDVAVIDPDSWASIVASVGRLGETSLRFQAAREFHGAATAPAEEPTKK